MPLRAIQGSASCLRTLQYGNDLKCPAILWIYWFNSNSMVPAFIGMQHSGWILCTELLNYGISDLLSVQFLLHALRVQMHIVTFHTVTLFYNGMLHSSLCIFDSFVLELGWDCQIIATKSPSGKGYNKRTNISSRICTLACKKGRLPDKPVTTMCIHVCICPLVHPNYINQGVNNGLKNQFF